MNKSNIIIIKDDITKQKTEAIVNAANSSLLGGSGVDGAIHKAAGKELMQECMTLRGCKTGKAKITKGYNLSAKNIIHAVGPFWSGGNNNERDLLYSCYKESLSLAVKNNIRSIAFPCISTGVYHFPQDEAAKIAIQSVLDFPQDLEIIFCCFLESDYDLYNLIIKELDI